MTESSLQAVFPAETCILTAQAPFGCFTRAGSRGERVQDNPAVTISTGNPHVERDSETTT